MRMFCRHSCLSFILADRLGVGTLGTETETAGTGRRLSDKRGNERIGKFTFDHRATRYGATVLHLGLKKSRAVECSSSNVPKGTKEEKFEERPPFADDDDDVSS